MDAINVNAELDLKGARKVNHLPVTVLSGKYNLKNAFSQSKFKIARNLS